eukprot:gene6017-7995_t
MGGDSMQAFSPVENATIGVAAGTIEVTILQPILYFKNAAQQGLPLSMNPRVLYRGLGMSVTNMSELVMIQQQRFGLGILETPSKLVAEAGASSLSRGLVMSCGREGLFCAGYLGMGPAFSRELEEGKGWSPGTAKFVGCVGAGVIAATLSHPMDTIKTCMQGDVQRTNYGTVSETAKTLHAEGGLGAFFKGWHWRTGRMICAIFIMGQCKDVLSPLFFPHHFE